MFRSSFANDAPTGAGRDKKSFENVYATEHALRYIGAYILVFEGNRRDYLDGNELLHCWQFGSERGFNMGFIVWYTAEHHAEPYWPKSDLRKVELAGKTEFAPWQLGFVGTSKGASVASNSSSSAHVREASSISALVSVVQGSEPVRLSVYELQPIDIGENVLQLTSRSGVLVSPDLDVEHVGEQFISVRTNGDGGCALHAVWGTPNVEHGFSLAGGQQEGRNLCCAMLADRWDVAKTQLGNWEVFEQISLSLWSELAEPGALGEDDNEARLVW